MRQVGSSISRFGLIGRFRVNQCGLSLNVFSLSDPTLRKHTKRGGATSLLSNAKELRAGVCFCAQWDYYAAIRLAPYWGPRSKPTRNMRPPWIRNRYQSISTGHDQRHRLLGTKRRFIDYAILGYGQRRKRIQKMEYIVFLSIDNLNASHSEG